MALAERIVMKEKKHNLVIVSRGPAFIVILVLPFLILSDRWISNGAWRFQIWGILPMAVGILIWVWSAWQLSHEGVFPMDEQGRPGVLVVSGPFQFTRNPLYVAVLVILAGEAILFESVALGVYVFLMWRVFRSNIRAEEPELREKFGAAYEEFWRTVPRWIGPRRGRHENTG